MIKLTKYDIERIIEIIEDCETIQATNESQHKKETAKIDAYEEIAMMVIERSKYE